MPPAALVNETTGWILEARDLSWRELTEDQLTTPISEPDEATLQAWHKANADRFTAPETRKLTYVWLTPEMLAPEVELDEDALRAVYDQHLDQYQQPERRMVGRLVFPSMADAEAGRQRLDAGEVTFPALVTERGLTLDDIDLGELTQDRLGAAGEAVFALEGPGIVGPVQTDLGPALFSMNAILDPVDIPFEQARDDLRQEAALDRAARLIEDRSGEFEDVLAGGAALEDMPKDTPMQLGHLDWTSDTPPAEGSIAGYQTFREAAAQVGQNDFPQIERLDDGGVFALRLDEVVPPTLIPFDEIRDQVAADWRKEEVHRLLLALADEERLEAIAEAADEPASTDAPAAEETATEGQAAEAPQPAPAASDWTPATGLTRDGWIDGVPPEVIVQAYQLPKPGEIDVVDAAERVFLVRLDAVHAADLTGEDALRVADAVRQRLGQSLQSDIFDYYAMAAQRGAGIKVNQSAIDAINAQAQ